MKIKTLRALGGAAFIAIATSSFAQVWNFDASAEGWQVFDTVGSGNYANTGNYAVTWQAAGGNPGGFISGADQTGGSFMFQAPVSNSNFSAFAGGLLQFSLQTDLSVDFTDDSVVVFKGGASNLTIVASLGVQPAVLSWTNYSINLAAGTFHYNNLSGGVVSGADFSSVLGDLDVFLINGEYHNGVSETSSLDSVRFLAPTNNGAVPEPSTYGILGAAILVGVSAWRRHQRLTV